MFLRDIAWLKMPLYCKDPTSVNTASVHLVSYGSCQTSYEVCDPHPANSAYALQKILEMSSTMGVWQDEDY